MIGINVSLWKKKINQAIIIDFIEHGKCHQLTLIDPLQWLIDRGMSLSAMIINHILQV